MSIIGPDMNKNGIGLFNWFYNQTGKIQGYSHAIWNGITTIELAKGIESAIKQDLKGLYHLVPKNNISKLNLLKLFKDIFQRDDLEIITIDNPIIDKTLVNTRKDFQFEIKDYKDMIEEMRAWILSHNNIYRHYEVNK